MLGLGIIIGAALMGAAWAKWGGWRQQPDRHTLYMRERQRALRAWYWPHKARHRKTMPRLIRTRTVRQGEAPLPLEL